MSLPTSRPCAICRWCCRPRLIRLWTPTCTTAAEGQTEGRERWNAVGSRCWDKAFYNSRRGNVTEGCFHSGGEEGARNKSSQFTAHFSLPVVYALGSDQERKIADTSGGPRWDSSTGWPVLFSVRKRAVQQTEGAPVWSCWAPALTVTVASEPEQSTDHCSTVRARGGTYRLPCPKEDKAKKDALKNCEGAGNDCTFNSIGFGMKDLY